MLTVPGIDWSHVAQKFQSWFSGIIYNRFSPTEKPHSQ